VGVIAKAGEFLEDLRSGLRERIRGSSQNRLDVDPLGGRRTVEQISKHHIKPISLVTPFILRKGFPESGPAGFDYCNDVSKIHDFADVWMSQRCLPLKLLISADVIRGRKMTDWKSTVQDAFTLSNII
jgi:hypothetical protein